MGKRETIKTLGYISISIILFFSIIAVILAGIDYNLSNPDWISSSYSPTSPLQIACVVFTIVLSCLGYLVFSYPKTIYLSTYEVFTVLSLIFNIAIGILVIAAGSVGYINLSKGCNAPISGLLGIMNGIDTYLNNVDQALCSKECPCNFKGGVGVTDESIYSKIYKTWSILNESYAPISFDNCTAEVKSKVYQKTKIENPNFDPDNSFQPGKFNQYMGMIENKFQCVGWCSTTYTKNITENNKTISTSTPMIKYLFTNINNGIPQNFGCVDQVINWLPQYLLSNGSCTLVQAVFQVVTLVLCFQLSNTKRRDDSSVIEIAEKIH